MPFGAVVPESSAGPILEVCMPGLSFCSFNIEYQDIKYLLSGVENRCQQIPAHESYTVLMAISIQIFSIIRRILSDVISVLKV